MAAWAFHSYLIYFYSNLLQLELSLRVYDVIEGFLALVGTHIPSACGGSLLVVGFIFFFGGCGGFYIFSVVAGFIRSCLFFSSRGLCNHVGYLSRDVVGNVCSELDF